MGRKKIIENGIPATLRVEETILNAKPEEYKKNSSWLRMLLKLGYERYLEGDTILSWCDEEGGVNISEKDKSKVAALIKLFEESSEEIPEFTDKIEDIHFEGVEILEKVSK